jgi:undecaprenyl diphosphate synthase
VDEFVFGDRNDPPFFCPEEVEFSKKGLPLELDRENIPKHIAIIMDGNGRWALKKNLKRSKGHLEGAKRVEEVIDLARELGIKVITLFTFSTENWKRPNEEVSLLMNMIDVIIKKKLKTMIKRNIRFQILGCDNNIPEPVLSTIRNGIEKTKNNDEFYLNLAFNYGSRAEIVEAVKEIGRQVKDGKITPSEITEDLFSQMLYTKGLPDPDLLIRTSGELRISNFLLWQLSYAELYFTDVLWPDFKKDEFLKAICDFQQRKRRYGGIGEDKVHE